MLHQCQDVMGRLFEHVTPLSGYIREVFCTVQPVSVYNGEVV